MNEQVIKEEIVARCPSINRLRKGTLVKIFDAT